MTILLECVPNISDGRNAAVGKAAAERVPVIDFDANEQIIERRVATAAS